MVVRVPDCKGELFPKGRVIVPCHTTFDSRKNMLTEVAHTDDKAKLQVNQVISKISNSNAGNCVTPENTMDNENALWNRQLNRWWGWNWQRKRQDCMAKCGHQNEDFSDYSRQERNAYNDQCGCHIMHKKPAKKNRRNSLITNCNCEPNNHQDRIRDCHSFTKLYRGRLKRIKHSNEYEGFLPEISSCTDTCGTKHKKQYLHLRVLNMHSNHCPGSDKHVPYSCKTPEKGRKNRTERVIRSDSDVVHRLNGKIYQNNIVKIHTNELPSDKRVNMTQSCEFAPSKKHTSSRISLANASKNTSSTQYAIAEDLNIVDSKDTIISKQEPYLHKDYNQIRKEHDELLSAVCEILRSNNSGNISDFYKDHNCVCCSQFVIEQNTENNHKKYNNKSVLLKK